MMLKLKMLPRSTLKGNVSARFPADLTGSGLVTVTNLGGSYEIGLDLSALISSLSTLVGDVIGPSSSTDNAIARYDGTTGKLIQNSSATISDAGTITIAPTAASTAQGFTVSQTGAGASASSVNFNTITVTEAINATPATAIASALKISHSFGSSASQGSRAAIYSELIHTSATSGAVNPDYVAGTFYAHSNVPDGGVLPGVSRGAIYGVNPTAVLLTGATGWAGAFGMEVDVMVQTGASAASIVGINVVRAGSESAVGGIDAAYMLTKQAGAAGWGKGLHFEPGMATTGTMIGVGGAQTVANVIDVTAWTVSGNVLGWANGLLSGAGRFEGTSIGLTVSANSGMTINDGTVVGELLASTVLTHSFAVGTNTAHPLAFVTTNTLRGSISAAGIWNIGVTGTLLGQMGFSGSTSGTATIVAQAAAGTPTITLPNTSGTIPTTVSAPLALNTTTGALSITGAAGQVLAGSTPAFTATPTLGASGTLGTITFGNATSGTITLSPVAGALGTVTLSMPATTTTLAGLAIAQTFTLAQTININPAANTSVAGLVLSDTTAATAGNQQRSPFIQLTGQGWKTDATAGSQAVDWKIENQPVQGTVSPTTLLVFARQTNAGGYNTVMSLSSDVVNGTVVGFSSSAASVQFTMAPAGGGGVGVHYCDTTQYIFGSLTAVPVKIYTSNAEKARFFDSGGFGLGNFTDPGAGAIKISSTISRAAPVTETTTSHTVAATTTYLICNNAGAVTVTLPAAASFVGRELYIKSITTGTVISNASNVVPSTSATAGTAILGVTDGGWARLVSDGTNWVIVAASPLI